MSLSITITDVDQLTPAAVLRICDSIRSLNGLLPSAEVEVPAAAVISPFTPEELEWDDAIAAERAAIFAAGGAAPLPPAATPAAAPTSTSAPSAPSDTSVELDKDGLPWDERIHSGGRAKNKDGTWRGRRNISDVEIARVTAQISGETPRPLSAPPPRPEINADAPPPPPPPPPADPLSNLVMTFPELVKKIQAALTAGTLSQTGLVIEVQSLGANTLSEVAGNPDLIAQLAAKIP